MKYGLNSYSGGLLEYEGLGIITENTPENIVISDDLSEASYDKGEYKVKLDIEWYGDTVKGYKRTVTDKNDNVIYKD